MHKNELGIAVKIRPAATNIDDPAKVRPGGESPSFGPIRMAPARTADNGKIRLGGERPSFGPSRSALARTSREHP
jgi:hypothetical protein